MATSVAEIIREKIETALAPSTLDITDESHLHQGHAGHREGGESHFRLLIVAKAFEGMKQVGRQRKIYQILSDEMDNPIHALALKTLTPDEAERSA